MNTQLKEGTDLRLPAAQDMERAATELASDALILGAGLRQIAQELADARMNLNVGIKGDNWGYARDCLDQMDAVILLLTEAGY